MWCVDYDITVKIIDGLFGREEVKVVTSMLNNGAVKGFTDRTVLEYSQIIEDGQVKPAGTFEIPPVLHGLISSLAMHQTLLGDAIAAKDPEILFHALFAYPVKQTTKAARELWKALLEINKDEIPVEFQKLKKWIG